MSLHSFFTILLVLSAGVQLSSSEFSDIVPESNLTTTTGDEHANQSVTLTPPEAEISAGLAVYRRALLAKRMEQRKSILMLHDIQDLKRQAKLAKPAIEKILEILERQRLQIQPNMTDFESLTQVEKEEISTILENILFLGDFVLRLPDTTGKLLKKSQNAAETVRWAVAYASSLNFLDETDLRVLDLMAQELNFIPRHEGYVNIYTESYKKQQLEAKKQAEKEAAKNKKSNKKVKTRPLMSGPLAGEL